MAILSVGIEPKTPTPAIIIGIVAMENCNPTNIKLTPAEARAFGLQLKVLADSIDRMVVTVAP